MKHLRKISRRRRSRRSDTGVALVIALLLVLLLTAMSVAMVVAFSSDMLINGYYGSSRGSFYAADSGLSIARQEIQNQLRAAIPESFGPTTQPIPTGTEAAIQNYIKSKYASPTAITGTGNTKSSWPAKFTIQNVTVSSANCEVLGGTGTCAAPTGAVTGYKYTYNYALTSVWASQLVVQLGVGNDSV